MRYIANPRVSGKLVLELIECQDRRVVACADAEAAWLQLQQQAFDVLVTDVNLPGQAPNWHAAGSKATLRVG